MTMKLSPKTLALASVPLLTVRVAWFAWPSVLISAAFWGALLLVMAGWYSLLQRRAVPRHCVVIAGVGAVLNGVVVMANGGYMPVHGLSPEAEAGIWRSAEDGGAFLFLADRMSWGGASPGDFFLAIGIAVGLSIAVTRGARAIAARRRAVSV